MRRSQRPAAIVACGCAGREHEPRCAHVAHALAVLQTRTDDARRGIVAFAQRRDEARRREHPRPGGDRRSAQDVVEALSRQHREPARDVDTAAVRRDAAELRRLLRLGHDGVETTELGERTVRVGDQAVAADLVARKRVGVDEDDVAAAARERVGDGAAGGSGADDDRVGALGQQFEVEVHELRAGCAEARRAGVIREAATIAAAVIVPTSANVSW